ncbi:MAG: hypothetical protein JWN70_4948, partial [Planctomycetaceae bacterium]|nr:hypothetical protein [Planctomycetaceae bacterium]
AKGSTFTGSEITLIHASQAMLWNLITAEYAEWTAAQAAYQQPVCADVGTRRERVTFAINAKGKFPNGAKPLRDTSSTMASLVVDPLENSRIEVAMGILFGFVNNAVEYSLKDTLVRADTGDGRIAHPGIFLLVRPWNAPMVWASLGVSTGTELKKPDFFAGFVARVGGDVATRLITIGVGGLFSAIPSGLNGGASVGHKLPGNVEHLDDVVNRTYRAGFGVMLSISGLELKK